MIQMKLITKIVLLLKSIFGKKTKQIVPDYAKRARALTGNIKPKNRKAQGTTNSKGPGKLEYSGNRITKHTTVYTRYNGEEISFKYDESLPQGQQRALQQASAWIKET